MNTLTNITKWYEQYHNYILQVEPEGQPLLIKLDCTDLPKILGINQCIGGKLSGQQIIRKILANDISEEEILKRIHPFERNRVKLRLDHYMYFFKHIEQSSLLYFLQAEKEEVSLAIIIEKNLYLLSLKKIEQNKYKPDTFEVAPVPTFYPGVDRLMPVEKIRRKVNETLLDFTFDEEALKEKLRDQIIDHIVAYHNKAARSPLTREEFLQNRSNLANIILSFSSFGGQHRLYYSVDLYRQTWTQMLDGEVFATGDFGSGTQIERLQSMAATISQWNADTYDKLNQLDHKLLQKKGYIVNERGFLVPIDNDAI